MEKRPKIRLKPKPIDRFLQITGCLFLAAIWIVVIFGLENLPEIIPTHFNIAGKADASGSKEHILIIPILSSLLFIGISALYKIPHQYNYTIKITEENAENQYRMAARLLRIINLVVVASFAIIEFFIVSISLNRTENLEPWILPLIIVSIFIPIAYYFVKTRKQQKTLK